MRLKVLMLTRQFPSRASPVGGTFCLERARALSRHADVRVMVPIPYFPRWLRGPKKWQRWNSVEPICTTDDGLRVTYPRYVSLPKVATWSQGLAMAWSVKRNLETQYGDWRPDIIDGHFGFPDGYAAARLALHTGIPVVITCHGSDLHVYPDLAITRGMLSSALSRADRVISVSSFLQRRSIELGCPEDKAVFLTNGVDPAKFALRSKQECRFKLGLPDDRPIGVYVGHLIDRKDQSLVVRATAEMVRRGQQPPLIALVGDGPNREKLRQEIDALGVGQHVLLAGQRPHDEVASWMGAADWLLLSSSYEGWATVYFEAMACGRPVLTSNVASATDAVCRPEYGSVVEPRTPAAFADAMSAAAKLAYDPLLIRQYAERHSWSNWADSAMAIFSSVLAERSARA